MDVAGERDVAGGADFRALGQVKAVDVREEEVSANGFVEILRFLAKGVELDAFLNEKLQGTIKELEHERSVVADLLG